MLLTWDINNDLSAKTGERFIFNRLTKDNRVNSTQRALAKNTEHYNETLDTTYCNNKGGMDLSVLNQWSTRRVTDIARIFAY